MKHAVSISLGSSTRDKTVEIEQLGELVQSLESEGQGIMDALDELLTRAWK